MNVNEVVEKACTKCGEVKPIEAFSPRKKGSHLRLSWCRECNRAQAQARRVADPEKRKASDRAYRERNKDVLRDRHRQWVAANPEKAKAATQRWRDRKAEHRRALSREWLRNNPEKNREYQSRRRARMQGNGVLEVADKDLRRILMSPCFACGTTVDLTLDHVIPIKKGGRHSIGNLLPLCGACNRSKQDKFLVEWLPERREWLKNEGRRVA